MRGEVQHIHRQRGMVAVLTDSGYSIIEITGDDVEVGDVLEWRGFTGGHERIRNLTQARDFDAYFQNHCVNQSQLRQQLLYH
jgi:hypothetical protein